jgi:hypothetical protein
MKTKITVSKINIQTLNQLIALGFEVGFAAITPRSQPPRLYKRPKTLPVCYIPAEGADCQHKHSSACPKKYTEIK